MVNNWNKTFPKIAGRRYLDSLSSGDAAANKLIEEFEERCSSYYGRHCAFVNSGTSALLIALLLCKEAGGHSLAVQDRSWIANLNVAAILGYRVNFVDVLADAPVADWSQLEGSEFNSPGVVTQLIHISGFICPRPKQASTIIEDFSQANVLTEKCQYIGKLGLYSVASLGITKALSSIHGGIFLSDDLNQTRLARRIARNGVENNLVETWGALGLNFKPNPFSASIGIYELGRIESVIASIAEVAEHYELALKKLGLSVYGFNSKRRAFPLYVELKCSFARELCSYLNSIGIQSKLAPPPLSSADYFPSSYTEGSRSKEFHNTVVILPSGPDIRAAEIRKVASGIEKFLDSIR